MRFSLSYSLVFCPVNFLGNGVKNNQKEVFMKTVIRGLIVVIFVVSLASCRAPESNITPRQIIDTVSARFSLQNYTKEDLKTEHIAERYGVSAEDITEGFALSDPKSDNPAKIIVLKAKSRDTLEAVERSLSNEAIALADAWKKHNANRELTDETILKTRGTVSVLICHPKAKEIEKEFDRLTK